MELRQFRYFSEVVQAGSMGRAAERLGVGTSALSQQISKLEGELSTRLLVRGATGVVPTEAGLAFWHHVQLALRHADEAANAAQGARLSGHVRLGLAPTTATMVGVPMLRAMRQRYPDIRVHLVESMSGHLRAMLNARQVDLAILFDMDARQTDDAMPLLEEQLFLIAAPPLLSAHAHALPPAGSGEILLEQLGDLPLLLPGRGHGLRGTLDRAFAAAGLTPVVDSEIDSLALVMQAVRAGLGATIQPSAALATVSPGELSVWALDKRVAIRPNSLNALSGMELSPPALVAHRVLRQVIDALVKQGHWIGVTLHEN